MSINEYAFSGIHQCKLPFASSFEANFSRKSRLYCWIKQKRLVDLPAEVNYRQCFLTAALTWRYWLACLVSFSSDQRTPDLWYWPCLLLPICNKVSTLTTNCLVIFVDYFCSAVSSSCFCKRKLLDKCVAEEHSKRFFENAFSTLSLSVGLWRHCIHLSINLTNLGKTFSHVHSTAMPHMRKPINVTWCHALWCHRPGTRILRKSFAGLFTDMSIDCSKSVVFGGSRQIWILLASKRHATALVTCPLKLSMITSAGVLSSKDLCVHSTYGMMMFFTKNHGFLIGPMLGGMRYIPIRRKLVVGMTAWWFTLVNNLYREKITHKWATKYSLDETFMVSSSYIHSLGTLLVHGPGVGWHNLDTCLIPVQNHFGWDFFHPHRGYNFI